VYKWHSQIRPVETAQISYKFYINFYIKLVPENQNLQIIVCSNIKHSSGTFSSASDECRK